MWKRRKTTASRQNGDNENGSKDASEGGSGLFRVSSLKKQLHEHPYEEEDNDANLLESDEEAEANRIGNVPLWWYDEHEHIGEADGGRAAFLEN